MLNAHALWFHKRRGIPLDRLNDSQLPSENTAPRTELRFPQNGPDVDTKTINLR